MRTESIVRDEQMVANDEGPIPLYTSVTAVGVGILLMSLLYIFVLEWVTARKELITQTLQWPGRLPVLLYFFISRGSLTSPPVPPLGNW